ncbi:MAG TPA: hypothetical protein VI078_09535 [bacterium]
MNMSGVGRGILALVIVLVAAVALSVGCGGGGGGDDQFDFNGTWNITSRVIQSNVREIPVGMQGVDVAHVTQAGTRLSVAIEGLPTLTGTCDPAAGTFAVEGRVGSGVFSIAAAKDSEETMSGTTTIASGPKLVRMTCTLQLVDRRRAAAGRGAGGDLGRAARLLVAS